MIVTKGCEPLYYAFVAAGMNAHEVLRNCGAIVQNDGVTLSLYEVNGWAEDATKRLLAQHREQLQLITDTIAALKAMK